MEGEEEELSDSCEIMCVYSVYNQKRNPFPQVLNWSQAKKVRVDLQYNFF